MPNLEETNDGGPKGLEIFTSLRYDPQLATEESSNGPFYMLDYHRDRLQESAKRFGFDNAMSRFEGSEGLDKLKETLLREVRSCQPREAADRENPCAVKAIFSSTGHMRTEIRPVEKVQRETLYPSSLEISANAGPMNIKPFAPSSRTGGALHSSSTSSSAQDGAPRPTWLLTLDTKPTPGGPLCTYKTTERRHYDEARARVVPEAARTYQQYHVHDVIMFEDDGEVTETSICSLYFLRGGKWVTPRVAGPDETQRLRGGNRGATRRWALAQSLCGEAVVTKDSLRKGELCWVSNGVRGFNMSVVGEGGGLSSSHS